MRRLAAITCCAVLAFGILGLPSQARAASVTSANQLWQTGITELKLKNFESAFSDGWSDDPSTWTEAGIIAGPDANGDATTYLRGIFNITNSQDIGGSNIRTPSGFELTGIFSTAVKRVSSAGGSDFLFELAPDPLFEAEFGSGAMVVFFNDTAPGFTPFDGGAVSGISLSDSYASATGGSKYLVLGAGGSQVWGDDYYWAANGSTTPSSSTFNASLSLLQNYSGIDDASFLKTLSQNPPSTGTGSFSVASATLASILNQFALNGVTNNISNTNSPWQLDSQDPLRAIVVPVPAASWLGATMLLGMLGLGIRKSRRRKAF